MRLRGKQRFGVCASGFRQALAKRAAVLRIVEIRGRTGLRDVEILLARGGIQVQLLHAECLDVAADRRQRRHQLV